TARRLHMPLFVRPNLRVQDTALGLLMLAATLGSVPWRFRVAPPERRARLLKILPQKPSHLWLWAAVSLAAGIFEEVIYRGVMFGIINYWTGWRRWPAVVFCTAVFAV